MQMIIGTAGVLLLGLILVYNTLVRYRNNVKKTFSSIDIQLKRMITFFVGILNFSINILWKGCLTKEG